MKKREEGAHEVGKEQLCAIETTDKNLLVSASAGSGKTTVLIERILIKLINKGSVPRWGYWS